MLKPQNCLYRIYTKVTSVYILDFDCNHDRRMTNLSSSIICLVSQDHTNIWLLSFQHLAFITELQNEWKLQLVEQWLPFHAFTSIKISASLQLAKYKWQYIKYFAAVEFKYKLFAMCYRENDVQSRKITPRHTLHGTQIMKFITWLFGCTMISKHV